MHILNLDNTKVCQVSGGRSVPAWCQLANAEWQASTPTTNT